MRVGRGEGALPRRAPRGTLNALTGREGRLEPARASLWLLTEPVFALGFGLVILGERPPALSLIGAAVILAGLFVSAAGALESRRPGAALDRLSEETRAQA